LLYKQIEKQIVNIYYYFKYLHLGSFYLRLDFSTFRLWRPTCTSSVFALRILLFFLALHFAAVSVPVVVAAALVIYIFLCIPWANEPQPVLLAISDTFGPGRREGAERWRKLLSGGFALWQNAEMGQSERADGGTRTPLLFPTFVLFW